MHPNLTYSQEKPHDTSKDIAALPIIIISSIIAGSMIKIGQIYFEKYLNENYGLQTTPTIPTILLEQTIKIEESEFNPYTKDNRDKKKSNESYNKYICQNGLISHKPGDELYKKITASPRYFLGFINISTESFTELRDKAIKSQQPRKLDGAILPKIPKEFNKPEYSGRQRSSKVLNNSFTINLTDKDAVKYLNYDLD